MSMRKISLSQSGIYPHKPTWIHKPIPGKEMSVPKSPDIIGKGSPTASPGRSPQPQKQDAKSPGIPTYVDIKKRLTDALREIEWYKSQQGVQVPSASFVTPQPQTKPKPKAAQVQPKVQPKANAKTPQKSQATKAKAKRKASTKKSEAEPQAQAPLSPEEPKPVSTVEVTGAAVVVQQEIQEIDTGRLDLYKKMLKETIHSLLSSGIFFSKIGRNGKPYARIVRWSRDMKSVEWFKSYNETPRFILMNTLNNAFVSLAMDEHSNEICTLSSDHRTLSLVIETTSQRHWADLTQHVVQNRTSISEYLDAMLLD